MRNEQNTRQEKKWGGWWKSEEDANIKLIKSESVYLQCSLFVERNIYTSAERLQVSTDVNEYNRNAEMLVKEQRSVDYVMCM